jgi:nitrogen fixation protein NifU and related proteins
MTKDNDIKMFRRIWELSQDSPYMAKMDDANIVATGENPLCGDWMEISFKVKNGKILKARFLHKGCAVSAAAASSLIQYLEGKSLNSAKRIKAEKHLKLFGAPVSPARLKCALLSLELLKSAKFPK